MDITYFYQLYFIICICLHNSIIYLYSIKYPFISSLSFYWYFFLIISANFLYAFCSLQTAQIQPYYFGLQRWLLTSKKGTNISEFLLNIKMTKLRAGALVFKKPLQCDISIYITSTDLGAWSKFIKQIYHINLFILFAQEPHHSHGSHHLIMRCFEDKCLKLKIFHIDLRDVSSVQNENVFL